ncbi:MAG: hypothetical protein ABUL62_13250 [Myxococcales bacterium]
MELVSIANFEEPLTHSEPETRPLASRRLDASLADSVTQYGDEFRAHFSGEQSRFTDCQMYFRREVAIAVVLLEAELLGTNSCDERLACRNLTKKDPQVH